MKNKKDFSLIFIQVVCAIAVVTLHTNGCFWQFSATERYWVTANIIESICYFAVPVFFMITGITLLDYQDRYSTGEYFRKRIEKTIIPYIAWSLIGVVFLVQTDRRALHDVSIKWVLNGLLSTDGIISLYWFFKPLFCVYLAIPLFAALDKEKKRITIAYLLRAGILINVTVPFFNSILHLGLAWTYQISVVLEYLIYVLGGWYLYHYPPEKKQKVVLFFLGLLGLIAHIVGTYSLSIQAGSIQRIYKGYNNLPCTLYSFAIFLFLRDIGEWVEQCAIIRRITLILGNYTFPLYLMQWFLLKIVDDLALFSNKNIWYRVFGPYPMFLLVIVVTWVLRKIPVVRKIVP